LLSGCSHKVETYVLPDQVSDFTTLFNSNCSGCHGRDGRSGAARPLNDALFLAVIGKDKLRDVITHGVARTSMPAFGRQSGGGLTDAQIEILATQIEVRWSRPAEFINVNLPPYTTVPGDGSAGALVFENNCAACHGGAGPSIVDPAFLDLVSDQSLRTTVIAGRSDRGMPNCEAHERPLTPDQISDVVAWLGSQRTASDLTEAARLESKGTRVP
jgi:cytochrome c oxidase cbb3-type subunit 3/ubiquinol-cytochrome c reductase cytochrome c subunit